MGNIKLVFNNFLSLLFSETITKIFSFIVIVYLARLMGPSGFGEINFAMAVFMYFLMLSTLGLDILGTREVAKEKARALGYIVEIGLIKMFLSVISYLLLIGFVCIFIKTNQMRLLILLYGLTLFPMAVLFEWAFQGLEKMHFIAFSRFFSNVIYLLLTIILIKSYKQILLVPFVYFISNIFAALFLIVVLLIIFKKATLKIELAEFKQLFYLAFPIGLSFVLAQIYYSFDVIMLGLMKNSAEVGYYSAAFKIYMFLIMFAGIFHSAQFPKISHFYKYIPQKLEGIYNRSNKIVAIFAVPLMIGGIIMAPKAMNLLYGKTYQTGILSLQILLCGILFLYVNTGYHRGLLACGKEKWYFMGILIPVVVNVVMNFVLIPPFGLNGSAFATLLGELTAFIVSFKYFNKIVNAPIMHYLLKPFIACIGMIILLLLGLKLDINIIILFVGAVLTYFISLFIIKGVSREDLIIIKQIFSAEPPRGD